MEYSETGNFSKEHRALCKKIRELINAAKKKDLVFKINKNKLCAYLMPELELAADEKANDLKDYDHPIKSLNCGIINQNVGDNEYYWEIGDIENEEEN